MNIVYEYTIAFVVGIAASVAASLVYAQWNRRLEKSFTFKQILKFVLDLVNSIESDAYRPDYIVSIDRNSSIVGGLISGHLGLKTTVTAATENKRNEDGSRAVVVSEQFLPNLELFSGKKLLLFICFNDTGTSLEAVYNHLNLHSLPPAEIRTAALFTSNSPKMLPRYFVKKVGADLKTPVNELMPKMPWVTKSWKHVFAKERFDI